MLNKAQISQIKQHLENAQNPIFFFDNDPDGLCSFLILRRYIERGRGVAIKSFPSLDESYFRKVQELNADYIFILDKPIVSDEFFKKVEEVNIPVVWIDHHNVSAKIPEFVNYYNPYYKDSASKLAPYEKDNGSEPVTALCYQVTGKKEDLWIAVIGCVANSYLPDFYPEFCKEYSDLAVEATTPFDVLYKSKIGEISRILSNGLKDTTTNVVSMLKFLINVKSPYDIFDENSKNHVLHYRHKQIGKKYKDLLSKAKKLYGKDRILFFKYSGDLSISGELSNELCYLFPEKIVIVAYIKGMKANLSLRGKNIREMFLKSIEGVSGATGGGHRDAVGGQMSVGDLDKFTKNLQDIVDK